MTEYVEAGLEKTVFWSGWNAGEVGMLGTPTTEKAENQLFWTERAQWTVT